MLVCHLLAGEPPLRRGSRVQGHFQTLLVILGFHLFSDRDCWIFRHYVPLGCVGMHTWTFQVRWPMFSNSIIIPIQRGARGMERCSGLVLGVCLMSPLTLLIFYSVLPKVGWTHPGENPYFKPWKEQSVWPSNFQCSLIRKAIILTCQQIVCPHIFEQEAQSL